MAKRSAVPSDDEYGSPMKYDPKFQGPLHRRSCTDIICLLIFFMFIVVFAAVGIFSIKNGDVKRLLVPTDSNGLKCGLDSGVEDKPYLVYFNVLECLSPAIPITGCPTPQVCVKSCPNETLLRFNINENAPISDYIDKIVCKKDVVVTSTKQLLQMMDAGNCAEYIFQSKPVSQRCMPLDYGDLKSIAKNLARSIPEDIEKILEENMMLLSKLNQMGTMIIEDLVTFRWWILASLLIVMIVCFIYIAIMRWLAAPVVWFSIVGLVGLLSFCVYLTYSRYALLRDNPVIIEESQTNLIAYVKSWFALKETWLVLLIIITVILVIILLALIFLRKRIVIAIALIKEGSKAVSSAKSTLFFPLFPWTLQCLIVAVSIVIGLYLNTIGESNFKAVFTNETVTHESCSCNYTTGSPCVPDQFNKDCLTSTCKSAICHFVGITSPSYIPGMMAILVVGFFWLIFFVEALGEMTLAATFATWYWTMKKSHVPFFTLTRGFARTIRYHIGTLAFGSLIITICRLIRLFLEYLDHKIKKYDNTLTRAIMCCLKCCFACLESFLRFLNKNAYIMCAVHGKAFLPSAKDAFFLLMRNIVRVVVLDKVTDFLFFLSKLLIAVGCGAAAYFAFTSPELYKLLQEENKLHYDLVPTFIIAIAAYIIASVFFSVYSMAVDTLFLCFLEDCERNDGSPEKPYFMSKELLKILGKKNKQT